MQNCRLIESGPATAAMNMAIDEAVATACRKGRSPTTLRFYTWNPPALSIGYFQQAATDVNLDRCRRMGIDLVRRLTGGRAVYHDRELTYSVAARSDDPLFPGDLQGTFLAIARALTAGLRALGVDAEVLGREETARRDVPAAASPSCFARAMGFEIGIDGRKLVGSAQRRWRDGFLQHGSILYDFDDAKLSQILRLDHSEGRALTRPEAKHGIISLTAVLSKIDTGRLQDALVRGFEQSFGVRLVSSKLTGFELDLAHWLMNGKYASPEWTLRR